MQSNSKNFTLTNIIIAITILMYFVQTNIANGSLYMGLNIYFFNEKLYYQVLSTIFAHGGLTHLLMNMLVLWQMGNLIESHIGKIRYLLLYFVGGVLTSFGALAYMYYSNDWANVVGASGAISVLMGYFALKVKEERNAIILWIVLISFAPLFIGIAIAWYAHIIGFVLGWILGYLV